MKIRSKLHPQFRGVAIPPDGRPTDLHITTVTQSLIAKAGEMREQDRWSGGLPWRSRQKAEMLAGDRIIGIEAERRFKTPASLFRPPTSPIKIPQVAVGLVVVGIDGAG